MERIWTGLIIFIATYLTLHHANITTGYHLWLVIGDLLNFIMNSLTLHLWSIINYTTWIILTDDDYHPHRSWLLLPLVFSSKDTRRVSTNRTMLLTLWLGRMTNGIDDASSSRVKLPIIVMKTTIMIVFVIVNVVDLTDNLNYTQLYITACL